MNEIDALKRIDETLSALDGPARQRILLWVSAKFGEPGIIPEAEVIRKPKAATQKRSKGSGTTKRSKSIPKQIKDLNLRPKGILSAVDFVAEKQPSNMQHKAVVAVYYLKSLLELENVTTDHVYTFFKNAGWPAPTDFPNTLQQAGSRGWLDTAQASDIKVTPIGENLVEHDLPKKAKD
jgi:hypothetical protein